MGVLKDISELSVWSLEDEYNSPEDLIDEILGIIDGLDDTYSDLKEEFHNQIKRICRENDRCEECYGEIVGRLIREVHYELDGNPVETYIEKYCPNCEE